MHFTKPLQGSLLSCAFLLAGSPWALPARAQDTPGIAPALPTQNAPLPPATAPAQVSKLLTDLASDDFPTRQAAQKQLNVIGWQNRAFLQQLADKATDPEVKASLLARVDDIDAQLAVDPPPISVDLKNASLGDVAGALSKATGVEIRAAGRPDTRFTLKAENQSFVAILSLLNQQHELSLMTSRDGVCLSEPAEVLMRGQTQNPKLSLSPKIAAVCIWSTDMGGIPGAKQKWYDYGILIDPRVRIADIASVDLPKFRDSHDNLIMLNVINNMGMVTSSFQHMSITSLAPNDGPDNIPLARGQATLTISIREQTREIKDPDKQVNELIQMGNGAAITFTRFKATEKELTYEVSRAHTRQSAQAAVAAGKANSVAELMITGKVIDAKGNLLTEISGTGGGISSDSPFIALPVKVILSVPTKTKQITVPIELRDIPLK